MKKIILFIIMIAFAFSSCGNDDNISNLENDEKEFDTYVRNADKQLRYMVFCLDSIAGISGIDSDKVIPIYLEDNNLILGTAFDWRSGFFPGICWIMFDITGDTFWKETASKFSWKIADAATYSQHDLGFMFNCSFGRAYAITNEDQYKEVLINAARTLAGRYNETIGCIQSWGSTKKWRFPVIIDAMMNMELLFEATLLTGDVSFWKMAVSHADNTLKNHYRDDYSSYHVVSYKENGEVECKQTSQGYSDESSWSRGQSWGLYGFTMCYRYTKDKKYLNQAIHIADYLLCLDYGKDNVPYWDMSYPDLANTAKDASAAAIMASALIELSEYVDEIKAVQYRSYAKLLLEVLCHNYSCSYKTNFGFLLNHSVGSYPTNEQVDVPAIYADYYYLEALTRFRKFLK